MNREIERRYWHDLPRALTQFGQQAHVSWLLANFHVAKIGCNGFVTAFQKSFAESEWCELDPTF